MLPEYEKHSKYSFEDANVAFIVEDRVKFDIHRHFLQRDSKRFSAILTAQSSHPDGIYRVTGLKVNEFESLLDFFYEGMYQVIPADTPIDHWVNLLSISTTMEFPRARERAITAIDIYASSSSGSSTLTPARMIQIANTYGVEKWLEPAYEALAERVEIIDEDEAEMIGMKGVLVVMRERETRLRAQVGRMEVSDMDSAPEGSNGSKEVDKASPEQTEFEDAPSSSEIPESTSLQIVNEADSQEPASEHPECDDQAGFQVEGQQSDPLPQEPWEVLNNKLLGEIDLCNELMLQMRSFNGPQSPKKLRRLRTIEEQAVIADDEVRNLIENNDQPVPFENAYTVSVLRKKRQGEFALESYMHSPSDL
ncbi:hypothetical protein AAF712_015206 [Marasmius tenuissimus]|uniref:BTB domain-containing protein n=1 Tax=Marasmius tenuissimus TaxID=585030 RepID=A0ABR2Z8Y4_9AGAR